MFLERRQRPARKGSYLSACDAQAESKMEAAAGFEPAVWDLQSRALPLGYAA